MLARTPPSLNAKIGTMDHALTKVPKISILTCCHRFLQRLKIFIKSFYRQQYSLKDIEILIANPSSPDGLHEYLNIVSLANGRAGISGLEVPTVIEVPASPEHFRNRGYLINRAFEKSSGDIIFVADCDCVFHPTLLHHAVKKLQVNPKQVLGVYRNFLSPETSAAIITGLMDPVDNFDLLRKEDQEESLGFRGVLGYCQILTRDAFAKVGYPEEFNKINQSDITFVERLGVQGISALQLDGQTALHLHHERNWEGVTSFM